MLPFTPKVPFAGSRESITLGRAMPTADDLGRDPLSTNDKFPYQCQITFWRQPDQAYERTLCVGESFVQERIFIGARTTGGVRRAVWNVEPLLVANPDCVSELELEVFHNGENFPGDLPQQEWYNVHSLSHAPGFTEMSATTETVHIYHLASVVHDQPALKEQTVILRKSGPDCCSTIRFRRHLRTFIPVCDRGVGIPLLGQRFELSRQSRECAMTIFLVFRRWAMPQPEIGAKIVETMLLVPIELVQMIVDTMFLIAAFSMLPVIGAGGGGMAKWSTPPALVWSDDIVRQM
jgi:hypothetical protein